MKTCAFFSRSYIFLSFCFWISLFLKMRELVPKRDFFELVSGAFGETGSVLAG
jgi:hypothetical protein